VIQLSPDCLLVQLANGERVPCSVEALSVELVGDATAKLGVEFVHDAAAAVIHHFKNDLGQVTITVGEFSAALEQALAAFGLNFPTVEIVLPTPMIPESDLRVLATAAGKTEILFYSSLRDEIRRQLRQSPRQLRFRGLRGCVKQLAGTRRWSDRCRQLEEQIVAYLGQCFQAEPRPDDCTLVVQ